MGPGRVSRVPPRDHIDREPQRPHQPRATHPDPQPSRSCSAIQRLQSPKQKSTPRMLQSSRRGSTPRISAFTPATDRQHHLRESRNLLCIMIFSHVLGIVQLRQLQQPCN